MNTDSYIKLLNESQASGLADLFSALSDPSRVRILYTLLESELSVQEIAALVEMSHSAVSHQLRGLRQTRMVRQVFYALDDAHVRDLLLRGLDHLEHD
jgi:DNA-binding transcriptional ArsR family regulator